MIRMKRKWCNYSRLKFHGNTRCKHWHNMIPYQPLQWSVTPTWINTNGFPPDSLLQLRPSRWSESCHAHSELVTWRSAYLRQWNQHQCYFVEIIMSLTSRHTVHQVWGSQDDSCKNSSQDLIHRVCGIKNGNQFNTIPSWTQSACLSQLCRSDSHILIPGLWEDRLTCCWYNTNIHGSQIVTVNWLVAKQWQQMKAY